MKAKTRQRQAAPAQDAATPDARIVQHPDGYYWQSDLHEVGPFATLDDARADMDAADDEETAEAPGETLAEAEEDLGVEGWIDPDTGAPAEEGRPRIEDH